LKIAHSRFTESEDYREFVLDNSLWLEDYALFMAIKEHFRGRDWQTWSVSLLMRLKPVMEAYREELKEAIRFQYFLQYEFFRQWKALRAYANGKGIKIIGDVPIYVPLDSADVWANPELFQLDPSRRPTAVAGCPPDGFSADGQLWGNPIYDWEKMHAERYHWWIRRMKAAARMYDVVRFDHFRGFESYWSVPAGSKTAATGSWRKGPGMDFVGAIRKALPDLPIIAEDLGYVTQEVKDLLRSSGYPGMKVMEFAFDTREPSAKDYLPHCYTENSVVYTGTHDNLTLKQWFDEAADEDIENAVRYLGLNDREGYVWGMIRGAMGSVSKLCIVQMQDYLEVGREGRMNHPGTLTSANWTWRARPGFASDALAQKIRTATELYGRM
jgi:4-alpha-glucanotransferase